MSTGILFIGLFLCIFAVFALTAFVLFRVWTSPSHQAHADVSRDYQRVEKEGTEYELPFIVKEEGTPGIELIESLEIVESDLEPHEGSLGLYRVFDIEGREFRPFVDPEREWTALASAPTTRESNSYLMRQLRERLRAALNIDTSRMELDKLLNRLQEEYDRGRKEF